PHETAKQRAGKTESRARRGVPGCRISHNRRAQWRRAEGVAVPRLLLRRDGSVKCAVRKTAQRLSAHPSLRQRRRSWQVLHASTSSVTRLALLVASARYTLRYATFAHVRVPSAFLLFY